MKSKYRIKISPKETINPEEIFLDSYKLKQTMNKNESGEGRIEPEVDRRGLIIFYALIIFILFFFIVRAGYLQLAMGEYYKQRAQENKTRIVTTKAPRGIIYDRFYNQLVFNAPSFDVLFIPGEVSKLGENLDEFIRELSKILNEPSNEIKATILGSDFSSYRPVFFKKNIDIEKISILESRIDEFPGLEIDYNSRREYLDGPYFAHILGYLNRVTQEDLDKNPEYYLTDYIGRIGVEASYEKILKGENGREVVGVNAQEESLGIKSVSDPISGSNITLSIDANLQKKIYDEMSMAMNGGGFKRGAAVALDPRSGEILSMVSFPGFDNNSFAQGINEENYAKLINDSGKPLFNRVVGGEYPSGSTIKPIIAAAALEEKIINPRKKILDAGAISIVNQYDPSIVYFFPDWKNHGLVDMVKAIAESCNFYFYTIGGGYKDIDGLGIEKIKKYLNLFGFGSLLGVDLSGESGGFVPDKKWKKEIKSENWFVGDTYHVSIGQGDFSATPLQVASATAAIANGGTLYKPHLLDKIITDDKEIIQEMEPEVIRENFIDHENLDVVRQGMRETVASGTARSLAVLSVESAGKTGTAQVGGDKQPHSWFTVFAPYDDPEIVLTILIENGGERGSTTVPVAREVLRWYFAK